MAERKKIPAKVQVGVAIQQAPGGHIHCVLCHKPLWPQQARILEHLIPHATCLKTGRDPDERENLGWAHASCSALKTNGPKHLKKDGDKSKIAAGDRLARAKEVHEAVVAKLIKRPAGAIRSRPFGQSRPMGHPRLRQTFRGKVVEKEKNDG